jgi:hypothetical protein
MARGKEITADKLEALGARRLAELLAELSTADPVVRKAAKLALAAGESPTKLLAEIDKRVRTIAVPRRSSTGTGASPWFRNSRTCGPPLPARSPQSTAGRRRNGWWIS